MSRILLFTICIAILLAGTIFSSAGENRLDTPVDIANSEEKYLIRYQEGIGESSKKETLSRIGAVLQYRFQTIDADVVTFPNRVIPSAKLCPKGIREIYADYSIGSPKQFSEKGPRNTSGTFVQPAKKIRKTDGPNDPYFIYQRNFSRLHVDAAWNVTKGSRKVIVGVLGEGFELEHEDLKDNLWNNSLELEGRKGFDDDGNGIIDDIHGVNFSSNNSNANYLEGTSVAGIIGAVADNGKGVAGMNHQVSLMMLKCNPLDRGFLSTMQCLDYAAANGAEIIVTQDTLQAYRFKGILSSFREIFLNFPGLVVCSPRAASSNKHTANIDRYPIYPASFDLQNIITVTAIDESGEYVKKWSRESTGRENVDLMSHYGTRFTTINSGKGQSSYDRSYCEGEAGFVAGTLALLKAAYPDLTSQALKNRILDSVDLNISMTTQTVSEGTLNTGKAVLGRSVGGSFTESWIPAGYKGPLQRFNMLAVYVPQRDVVVGFGGAHYNDFRNMQEKILQDTWEFDGHNWVQKSNSGPGKLFGAAMALDRNGKVVLFGGTDYPDASDATWLWDGETWTEINSPGLKNRSYHAMTYDENRKITVLYGGSPVREKGIHETWEWDGNSWKLASSEGPPVWNHCSIAYDSKLKVVLLYGGKGKGSEGAEYIWKWNGKTWKKAKTKNQMPQKRYSPGLAYDQARQKAVLFGGTADDGRGGENDTWEWDGKEWHLITWRGPSKRVDHTLVYDSKRKRVLLLGGYRDTFYPVCTSSKTMMQTWQYNGPVAPIWIDNLTVPISDIDSDGKADIGVWRPSTAEWIYNNGISYISGSRGHIPVPGDYNGDGKIEFATFNQIKGNWHVSGKVTKLGRLNDIPAPADYNGDGKTDLAVYRPSAGMWYFKKKKKTYTGEYGAYAVPADYNGDGKDQIATYNPYSGQWVIEGMATIKLGSTACSPVPADYNGDGVFDIAIFNNETCVWTARDASSGKIILKAKHGQEFDIPVPGDYNGNGKAQIATFRPATGTWHIRNQAPIKFGEIGDVPLVRGK